MQTYDVLVADRREDSMLFERLMARDEGALREVIEAHQGSVYGLARRVIREPHMAEEVAQDAFVALWRRPGAYDPAKGSIQSFLMGITRNKAVDLIRKEESLKRTKDSLQNEADAVGAPVTGTSLSHDLEEREMVKDALKELTDLQREAVVLAYFGGRTYREVAAELRIPEGTAKTRLRDGLMRLKEILRSSGMVR